MFKFTTIKNAKEALDLSLGREVKLESEALEAISYNKRSKVLTVRFTSGNEYRYKDVSPEEVKALRFSPSQGRYFSKMLRNDHKFEKVSS